MTLKQKRAIVADAHKRAEKRLAKKLQQAELARLAGKAA